MFLFAFVLAQTLGDLPPPLSSPAPSPGVTDGPVRRPPPQAFVVSPEAALIVNAGSTNFAGYKIAVERDGTVAYQQPSGVTRGRIPAATAKHLFRLLAADRPLDALPLGACMKSVSFGSATTITWNDQTTPDISCAGNPRLAELNRTVGVIVKQLDIVPQPKNRRYIE